MENGTRKLQIKHCKFCGNSEIEKKIHSFFECRNFDKLRKDTFERIGKIEEVILETKDSWIHTDYRFCKDHLNC